MTRLATCLALAALFAAPAAAQFELFQVTGNVEVAVPSIFDFGSIYSGESTAAQFRVRNISTAAATLAVLSANGAGFTLAGPAVPLSIAPAASIDFTVTFQASSVGTYSAPLDLTGLTVLLTATVAPWLTYSVELPAGRQMLGTLPVNFGTVAAGAAASLQFDAVNQTSLPLIVPAIVVSGDGFSLTAFPPSGRVLQPQQQTSFNVQFSPAQGGTFTGAIAIGNRTYALSGNSPLPVLPMPVLNITLPQLASAQQGSLAVNFDTPAVTSGSGAVTLIFQPLVAGVTDPAITFANGKQSVSYTFAPGDTHATFAGQSTAAFQTGATAGTLVFTATLGANTVQQSLLVPPAAIGLNTVSGARAAGSVSVTVDGFDNTRTAGALVFTFFDASGASLSPGGIVSDGKQAFLNYFSISTLGGLFQLNAVFPVSGDPSQIASVVVQFSNSVGATTSARTSF